MKSGQCEIVDPTIMQDAIGNFILDMMEKEKLCPANILQSVARVVYEMTISIGKAETVNPSEVMELFNKEFKEYKLLCESGPSAANN